MPRITLQIEEGKDLEILLEALNRGEVGVRLTSYTKSDGWEFHVKDREAIKALVDRLRVPAEVTKLPSVAS